MPKRALYLFFFVISIFVTASGKGQEFTRSKGMILFNQGRYTEAVTEIRNWLSDHPEELDVANYYLGEAYYNLAMEEVRVGRSREQFRSAFNAFQKVLNVPGVKTRYPKLYYASQLKQAWCYFRRAETGEQQLVLLENAYQRFLQLDEDAPDTLRMQAMFMAGESRYREGTIRKYIFWAQDNSLPYANKLISVWKEAKSQFQRVSDYDGVSSRLRLLALIRTAEINYQLGHLYGSFSDALFSQIYDPHKGKSAKETALLYLNQANFTRIIQSTSEGKGAPFWDFLRYLEGMRLLQRFLLTGQYEDRQKILEQFGKAKLPELEKDIQFRRGMVDHNTSQIDDNDNFFNLCQNDDRSYYYRALTGKNGIEEAYFWLGAVQFIVNKPDEGIINLHRFIQEYSTRIIDPRTTVLLDYARYWRGMLFLEANRRNKNRIMELRDFLRNFHPETKILERRLALLEKLTRLELGEDVWENVLEGRDSERWFEEALDIIQYLLRRAAMVVGQDRLHYLHQLDRIFYYTNFQKANETSFYQGIAKSLEAEIQGDENDKRNLFRKSAELLSGVTGDYRLEARYIQGRSLFFAEEYDQAKTIFRQLINERQSLRSLYYFAEILRLNDMGNAARKCYEVIKQKTQLLPDGKFWFLNAESAINLCRERVDGSKELKGLNYKSVVYPEKLFDQSYEQLAERRFLQLQYLSESLDLLKKFALPPKTFYPTLAAPKNSTFRNNVLEAIPSGLNDLLKRETSVLEIWVLGPEESIEVQLNGKSLSASGDGHFRTDRINVGDKVNISVSASGYYRYEDEIPINIPGKQKLFVPLTEKVNFRSTMVKDLSLQVYPFKERLDGNVIVQRAKESVLPESELMRDLSSTILLRDVAYHAKRYLFLAIDANQGKRLRRYNLKGERIRGNSWFPLHFEGYDRDSLRSPEGIAVDHQGNIYITDFADHRVVVFDSLGNYRFHFGGFGKNTRQGVGDTLRLAKFVFPTRIAIEEDVTGVEVKTNGEGTRVYRQPFILVADRYGIHKCTGKGLFVETILQADQIGVPFGSIYGFGIQGYGRNAKLFMALRENKKVLAFTATQ